MDSFRTIKRVLCSLVLMLLLLLLDFSAGQGSDLPDSAYIKGVTGHPQKHSISCESRSAADLAAYWGISLGENEFLEALPRSDNPEQGFVGNPDDGWGKIPPQGYGVHAGPVAETLRSFGLNAKAHNHLGWDDLRTEISSGRPVIVWIVGAMWTGKAVEYQAQDGSTSIVARYEHTMILVGYSGDSVQVVDAFSGQYQTYPLNTFRASWSVLGNMAVFTSLEADSQQAPAAEQPVTETEQQAPATEQPTETYIVQPGDYLTELARRFSTSLQALIDQNSISYPFTIYPGQVLQVPRNENSTNPAQPAQPVPSSDGVKHAVYLPVIQKEATIQVVTEAQNMPVSQEGVSPASSPGIVLTAQDCSDPAVNWALLARLRHILVPVIYNNGGILLK